VTGEQHADTERRATSQPPKRPIPKLSDGDRIRAALARGEGDCEWLDGRNFDRRYWTNAKAALGRIERRLAVAEGERDALRAVFDR
jgi:hypothetical protein